MPEQSSAVDRVFAGALPEVYQSHLVPLIFQPYADDLVRRLAGRSMDRLLEIACGTGVVTRRLAAELPASVSIVASDLNQGMLDQAGAVGTARPVEWRKADAMELPFEEAEFDAVVIQFGAMFFPDKAKAFAEARRVLRPGGLLLLNVWDRIEENQFADVVTNALAQISPLDPPRFMVRIPHGYSDRSAIERDLAGGGFSRSAEIETVARQSRADSPEIPAIAFCQGTPLRNEIEARDPQGLSRATSVAAEAIAQRFGRGAVEGKIQAHVVMIEREQ